MIVVGNGVRRCQSVDSYCDALLLLVVVPPEPNRVQRSTGRTGLEAAIPPHLVYSKRSIMLFGMHRCFGCAAGRAGLDVGLSLDGRISAVVAFVVASLLGASSLCKTSRSGGVIEFIWPIISPVPYCWWNDWETRASLTSPRAQQKSTKRGYSELYLHSLSNSSVV
jgi:hypothetical protein